MIQTTIMDCGPAALASLLRGFGRPAQLEGLRDVCQTGIDGTSIDVLTDLAVALGLAARQVVVPADHLRSEAAGLLPAIVVAELPGGLLHFVVVWRRLGRWFLVMDPAVGRQWVGWDGLRDMLYRHAQRVPAAGWRDYAGSEAFREPLQERLRALGASERVAAALVDTAADDPGWQGLARLDAAARAADGLAAVTADADPPEAAWMVRPAEDDTELVMAGAVVLTVDGTDDAGVADDLAERVFRPLPSPRAILWSLLDRAQRGRWYRSTGAATAAAAAAPLLVFWLQRLVEAEAPALSPQVGLVAAFAAIAVLSLAGHRGVLATGRAVDLALRRRLDERVGRLPEAFFRSRPASDLTERAHAVHRLRDLPLACTEATAAGARLVACVVGVAVAAPGRWWVAVLLGVVSAGVPAGGLPALVEVQHRSRTLAGALAHVYLDALVGLFAVRAHRAAAAVHHEHGELLEPWRRTQLAAQRRTAVVLVAAQLAGYAVALPLIAVEAAAGRPLPQVLVVAFFALLAVDSGLAAVLAVRQIAPQWAVARRLLALLAHDLEPPAATAASSPAGIDLDGVTVVAEGVPVLDAVQLSIRPGEHVALLGPSGAGKSTLLATLLGWATPEEGTVTLDGAVLDPARAVALRTGVVWVDPETVIWSGTMADNLVGPEGCDAAAAVESAALGSVVTRLGGLDGHVGESGRLLSGGEAQRLRLARGFTRAAPRLVVLDEAFRGLDAERRAQLTAESRSRWAGTTVVATTHHVEETLDWDRVVVFDGGRIVDDGDPRALLDAGGAYAALIEAGARTRAALSPGAAWGTAEIDDGTVAHQPGTGHRAHLPATQPRSHRPPHGTAVPAEHAGARRRAAGWAVLATVAIATATYAYVAGWVALAATVGVGTGRWWGWFTAAALLTGLYGWALGRSGVEVGTLLRERLIDGVLRADLDATRQTGAGELQGRVMEADSFEQLLLVGAAGAVVGVAQVTAAALGGVVAGVGAPLVSAIAAWAALTTLLVAAVSLTRRRWSRSRVELSGLLVERFRGHRTEQVYGPPPHAGEHALVPYEDWSRRVDAVRALLIGAIGPAWLTGGIALALATAEPATVLAAVGVTLLAWDGFSTATLAADDLTTAAAAREQFSALLRPHSQARSATDDDGPVALHDVSLTYPGADRPALRSASLRVDHGDHLLLVGPSGAGKTTLASVLAGIRHPDAGAVTGAGRVLYVPQFGDNHLFQAPLAFNLLLGRGWPPDPGAWEAMDDILDELGLAGVVARMPRELAQPVGECGWQLSHGERTRCYLARALLQDPEVLILDETLAGLDPATTLAVIDSVRRRVASLVLITHP